jgi:hypothetical protein
MRGLRPFLVLAVVMPLRSATAQTCDLQGAWQMESSRYDGQPAAPTYSAMKVFTKTRFAVIGDDAASRGPLVSDADRLKFLSNLNAAGGSYVVSADSWTEKIDYFSDPAYIGISLTFQCVREGDRLIQKGTFPIFDGGKKVRDVPLEEVWRRVDRP